jgi:hypothetical protein
MMGVAMPTMAVVHENMHQGACQQDEKWQRTHDVSQMLRQQEVSCYSPQYQKPNAISGTPEGWWIRVFGCVFRIVSAVHLILQLKILFEEKQPLNR